MPQYLDFGGDDVQLLGNFLTDDDQGMAFRAVALWFRQLVDDVNPREFFRQGLAATLG
jgi:hypothetical protein